MFESPIKFNGRKKIVNENELLSLMQFLTDVYPHFGLSFSLPEYDLRNKWSEHEHSIASNYSLHSVNYCLLLLTGFPMIISGVLLSAFFTSNTTRLFASFDAVSTRCISKTKECICRTIGSMMCVPNSSQSAHFGSNPLVECKHMMGCVR